MPFGRHRAICPFLIDTPGRYFMRVRGLLLLLMTVSCAQGQRLEPPLVQQQPENVRSDKAPVLPPSDLSRRVAPDLSPPKCDQILYLTEIQTNPRHVSDRDGEFIELYNPGPGAVSLAGWRLTDLRKDEHIVSSTASFTIQPGAFAVLGPNADPNQNGGHRVDYQYDHFHLSNEADRIVLQNACGDISVDVKYPDEGWPRMRAGRSLERSAPPAADQRAQWRRSRHRLHSGDYGTPGFAPWAEDRPPATRPEHRSPAAEPATPHPPSRAATASRAHPVDERPTDSTQTAHPTDGSSTE